MAQEDCNEREEREQLHAGKGRNMSTIWSTDVHGHYQIGDLYHRTPRQLFQECHSIIRDLLINHPGIEEGK